jgi:hypothetical protein
MTAADAKAGAETRNQQAAVSSQIETTASPNLIADDWDLTPEIQVSGIRIFAPDARSRSPEFQAGKS